MPVKCKEISKALEKLAPLHLAQEWDNVGLIIGDFDLPIKKVLIALDLTRDVLNEALEKKVDLIVTHHPLIFKPFKKIIKGEYLSDIIIDLVKNDIALYASHTNLDIAVGGTNDFLAEILNLKDISQLMPVYKEPYYKIVVFTPTTHVEHVFKAIGEGGGGKLGNYSDCTFQTEGIGTFKPLEGSNPYIGSKGNIEKVREVKIEAIVSETNKEKTIKSILAAHPYEEVAYDLIPLANDMEEYGFGRVGYLDSPVSLMELANTLKYKLNGKSLRIIGDKDRKVQKIAICTGSGGEFIDAAIKKNCDCYITGDIKYHDAQHARERDLAIIDAGHFETENIICNKIKNYLDSIFTNDNIEIMVSSVDSNPFITI